MRQLAATVLAALCLAGCGNDDGAQSDRVPVILATTTSTQDSGLLDVLIPAFERESGYQVKTIAIGSGEAIEMGARGEADVVLAHSPAAEEELMADGKGGERRTVMHNDFVLVGPAAEAAEVRGATAAEALARIAQARAPFVSRGDESGTHTFELGLWEDAGRTPDGDWYQESGQGMGATLQIANDKDAYTISDRGTYLATESARDLEVLVEGGAELLNVYHVIDIAADAGERVNAEGGKALADWLVSPAAQGEIETFGVEEFGEPLFVPDAGKTDAQIVAAGYVDVLWDALVEAFRLLLSGDAETWEIIARSLRISLTATALALLLGLPVGAALAFGRFRGRRIALALVNTGMGVPPVVAGLVVTVLLWRSGPFGALGLLYTPTAMVIAQTAIALPLVAGFSTAALQHVDPDFRLQMQALGAGRLRSLWTVALEARLPLLAAGMAGFGAVISEVGAALMVGGNIAGQTRVLTTAAVLEASKGAFARALAFGIILLVIAFAVNLVLTAVQQHGRA